jgi:membrane protein YqaA with SNARE-associated domain
MANPTGITEENKSSSRKREYLISAVGLVLVLALCALVIVYWDYIQRAGRYGYLGVLIISIITGVTILIPVPGLLVVFTLGSILEPSIVGALAGLGEAIGSIIIYLTGYGGRSGVTKLETIDHRFTTKFEYWLRRRGSIAVFAMSSIINPLFFPFTAIAGAMRFGLTKFFFLCWAGKTIKGMAVAYLGYYGLGSILRWTGIGV